MSDVTKTNELIAEARESVSRSCIGKPTTRELDKAILMIRRLADALASALVERDAVLTELDALWIARRDVLQPRVGDRGILCGVGLRKFMEQGREGRRMEQVKYTPGRIEAAQKAAEEYAEQHRNERGSTNLEGGMMLHLVSIIEELKIRKENQLVYVVQRLEDSYREIAWRDTVWKRDEIGLARELFPEETFRLVKRPQGKEEVVSE